MTQRELFAVVMAGGSGTRFWPASRRSRPKQFLPIAGARPMIAETVRRLEGLVPPERVIVVTAKSQVELVREAVPEVPVANVLAEPCARNTAACVALAAYTVADRAPGAVQVVLPADHVIRPVERFQGTLLAAAEEALAEPGCLVTFGVRPTHPATGYGYIEAGARLREQGGVPVHAVERFVEKPDEARAREFLASGRFFWNSGMFVWSTDSILAAFRRHLPEMADRLASPSARADLDAVYPRLQSVPVDVGIMEREENVRMLPIDYSWSDVGSWAALPEVHEPDAEGNWRALAPGASLVGHEATGCVAYADADELIALVGVRDLVVVRAGRTTLVCPRDRAQDVKKIVELLERSGSEHV